MLSEAKKKHFPEEVKLVLTKTCNLACLYCFGDYKQTANSDLFDFSRIPELFKELKRKGTFRIILTGGEPLMHNQFYNILTLAFKYFPSVKILSNGVLFTNEIINLIVKNNKGCKVQISIDGISENTNAIIRQKKHTWNKTKKTIEALTKNKTTLSVIYMLNHNNKNEIEEAITFLQKTGVTEIEISSLAAEGRAVTNESLILNDGEIGALQNKYPHIVFTKNNTNSNFCSPVKCDEITIMPNGDIIGCQLLSEFGGIMGNAFSGKKENLFTMKNYIYSFYAAFQKNENREECSSCKFISFCSKCLLNIHIANRELLKTNGALCNFVVKSKMHQYFTFN